MSKQGSQHEFPELGEDEEELDLPGNEETDIEYDLYDHDFRDYLGEDADQEEEVEEWDEPDYGDYDPYDEADSMYWDPWGDSDLRDET